MHPLILYTSVREEHARRGRQVRLERAARSPQADPGAPAAPGSTSAETLAARMRGASVRLVGIAMRRRTRVA